MNPKKEALKLHERLKGKIELKSKIKINKKTLSLVYTPYVAEVVNKIRKNKKDLYKYTGKGNNIAIISDGTRILGLGNLGSEAALPIMEGKALLYKIYGNVDAYPICLKTQNKNEIINIVKNIAVNFGAINIEDIETPKSFEIVDELSRSLDIPVFHDDQHGTAVITLSALLNSLRLVKKKLSKIKIVVLGAGAAGFGITKLLRYSGAKNILVLDSKGIIYRGRDNLNRYKTYLARITNFNKIRGNIINALTDADVFIGVSGKNDIIKKEMIKIMKKDAIVFVLSNPSPEISYNELKKLNNVKIIATGRSDFKNQVNNFLVFPFIMRYILDKKIKKIDERLLYDFAIKISDATKRINYSKIIPEINELF